MNKFLLSVALLCNTFLTVNAQVSVEHDETPEGSISVQPMENYFTLKAGQSKEARITINNRSNRKMQFNLYLNDWTRDETGTHVYTEPGTEPHSCTRWVSLDKKFIEVDSNAKGVITVKMTIPDSPTVVEQMKWSMLFIESIEESKAPENIKTIRAEVVPKMRWGVHLYQTPPTVARKEIKLISFKPLADSINTFRLICKNTGDVQTRCKSYVEISSMADNKKTTLPVVEVPTFPGQERFFDFKLPANTPKGKYTLVGVVDAGVDMDIEASQLVVNIE